MRPQKPNAIARAVAAVHGWFQPERLVPWQVVLAEHSKLGLPLSTHYPLIAMAIASRR